MTVAPIARDGIGGIPTTQTRTIALRAEVRVYKRLGPENLRARRWKQPSVASTFMVDFPMRLVASRISPKQKTPTIDRRIEVRVYIGVTGLSFRRSGPRHLTGGARTASAKGWLLFPLGCGVGGRQCPPSTPPDSPLRSEGRGYTVWDRTWTSNRGLASLQQKPAPSICGSRCESTIGTPCRTKTWARPDACRAALGGHTAASLEGGHTGPPLRWRH